MKMQVKLIDNPVNKKDAQMMAHLYVREKYGNLPSVGIPAVQDNIWVVPINVKYPRVFFDKGTDRPKKVRYMNFEKVGEIKIDGNSGEIIDKPRYFDIKSEIKGKLDFIQNSVQKALVKTGAQNFSKLPFSEHMHTPIEDILAFLLLKDKLDLQNEISLLNDEERDRYMKNIDLLISTGLIRQSDNLIIPDNALIEIERSTGDIYLKMNKALSYFFAQGYENISSIQQVLGPYLTISGYIYSQSIEYDDVIPVEFQEIQSIIQQNYGQLIKQMKIPRYLIQLNEVGLIDQTVISGEDIWLPKKDILRNVKLEDTLLSPIRNMFIDSRISV
jgi:hypothetical protein